MYNFYQIDPSLGTMDDFLRFVQTAHKHDLRVIAFLNVGYSAMNYPPFLKACDDVQQGRDSHEARWFIWSDSTDKRLDRTLVPYFMNDMDGHWHYNERAGKHYWVKWTGIKDDVALPQFNFGDPAWQEECRRILRFWLDTGIDGIILDAVNWYVHCDWEVNRETLTDIVNQRGNQYLQPEGAGGFEDDPVPWIVLGEYNSVQDYGLQIWWNSHDVIGDAILTGCPRPIEKALRAYRDRVVAAGGVTYIGPNWSRPLNAKQRLLEIATIVTIGELFHDDGHIRNMPDNEDSAPAVRDLLRALQRHPALQAASDRVQVPTQDDDRFYAYLRRSPDQSQSMLVVLNYRETSEEVVVRLGMSATFLDILSNDAANTLNGLLHVQLPGYGYRLWVWLFCRDGFDIASHRLRSVFCGSRPFRKIF